MTRESIEQLTVNIGYMYDNITYLYPEGCEVHPLQESGLFLHKTILVKYPIKKEKDVYRDANNNILYTKDLFGLDTYAKKGALLREFTSDELLEVYNMARNRFSNGDNFHPINKLTIMPSLGAASIINGKPHFEKELHGDQHIYILRWSANVWVNGVWAIPINSNKTNYYNII